MRAGTFWLGLAGLVLLAAPHGAAAESIRVALLPIVVHSSEPDSGYVQKGLGDMLASRIERTPGVAVVRPSPQEAGTTLLGAALQAGRALGAEYVIYGSFTQFGTGASLDVRCSAVAISEDDESSPRQIFVQTGSTGEIIPKLDDLAEKVGRYVLGGGVAGAGPVSAGAGGAPGDDGPSEIEELRARVEALENLLFDPTETIGDSGNPLVIDAEESAEAETVAGDGGP